jgi:hypothetical protein
LSVRIFREKLFYSVLIYVSGFQQTHSRVLTNQGASVGRDMQPAWGDEKSIYNFGFNA